MCGTPSHLTSQLCDPVAPRSLRCRWHRSESRGSFPQWGCCCPVCCPRSSRMPSRRCSCSARTWSEHDMNKWMIWQLLFGGNRCNSVSIIDNWDKDRPSEGLKAKVNSKYHVSFLFLVGRWRFVRLMKCYLFYISYCTRTRSRGRSRSWARSRSRSRNSSSTTTPHPWFYGSMDGKIDTVSFRLAVFGRSRHQQNPSRYWDFWEILSQNHITFTQEYLLKNTLFRSGVKFTSVSFHDWMPTALYPTISVFPEN